MKQSVLLGLGGILLGLGLGLAAERIWIARTSSRAASRSQDAGDAEPADEAEHERVVHLTAAQIEKFGIGLGQAGPARLLTQVVLPGEIELDPDKAAYIVPRVSGVAVRTDKTVGDPVEAGEVMAVIDSRELADAKAACLTAVGRLSLAQAAFEREQTLREKAISSQEEYLSARQALAEAKIELRSAEQKLYSLGLDQNSVAQPTEAPNASYTRYEVRAPFAGTVIDRQIGLGEVVTDTSQIYRIADLSMVWAELTVYPKDLGAIHVGQTAALRADEGDLQATGAIQYISPILEEATRTAVARVVLFNPERTWRPGMFVTARVDVDTADVPVAVARSAIQKIEGQDVVFVVTDKGFQLQPVRVGRTDPLSAEILRGLNPGQPYVQANAFTLKAELSKGSFAEDDD